MRENLLYKTALSKAMALSSRIEYCPGDMRKKLQLWGVSTDDENKILDVLKKENFINEDRYAKAFVRDKFRNYKWGKVKIAAHLKAKGIKSDTIGIALGEIDSEEYIDLIKNLITSRRKTLSARNQYELKGKLLKYGLSKGFESNLLYDLLNDIED